MCSKRERGLKMKKINYICAVFVTMLVSILVDCLFHLPNKLFIAIYVILFGIASSILPSSTNSFLKKIEKNRISFLVLLIMLSLTMLIIHFQVIMIPDENLLNIVQIVLAFTIAVLATILINLMILKSKK